MAIGAHRNSDDVFIALLILFCFPFSPFIIFYGVAAKIALCISVLCGAKIRNPEELDKQYAGYSQKGALAFVGGPIVLVCLPFYISLLGINTLIAWSYELRGKETPGFIQRNEWRGFRPQLEFCKQWPDHLQNASRESSYNDESYQYEKLRQGHDIRILDIHPGQFAEPLHVSLRIANLSHHPVYDALSYTWADDSGDARRSVPIAVSPNNTVLMVTPNCAQAMRRLRLSHSSRKVWIDALCIDQAQNLERNHQVSLMARIYTQARHVIIYTGEASPDSDRLFDWFNGLDGRSLEVCSMMRHLRLLSSTSRQGFNPFYIPPAPAFHAAIGVDIVSWFSDPSSTTFSVPVPFGKLQDSLQKFVLRQWFSRVWVVQEFAMADARHMILMAGDKEVSALRAIAGANWFLQHDRVKAKGTKALNDDTIEIFHLLEQGHFHEHYHGSGENSPKMATSHLLHMLIAARAHACEDPRDKIFAVLRFAQEWDRAMLPRRRCRAAAPNMQPIPPADYALSTCEVFTRYSAFFIREHGLGFFLSLKKSPSKVDGLPSWAADWTVPWPNMKATKASERQQEDIAASTRKRGYNGALERLVIPDWVSKNGETVLVIQRPRNLSGFFSREAHLDDAPDISDSFETENVGMLENSLILVDMNPGLAILLEKEKGSEDDYKIVCVCSYARTLKGLRDVVAHWSSVVIDGHSFDESSFIERESEQSHLSELQSFRIH